MTNADLNLATVEVASLAEEFGVSGVLEMLAKHCENRVKLYGNDDIVASVWNQAKTNLMVCSEFVFRKPLTTFELQKSPKGWDFAETSHD